MGQTNKADLIATLTDELNLPVREVTKIVDTILTSMSEALARGEGVEVRGLGSFSIREYESYNGRNPKSYLFSKSVKTSKKLSTKTGNNETLARKVG